MVDLLTFVTEQSEGYNKEVQKVFRTSGEPDETSSHAQEKEVKSTSTSSNKVDVPATNVSDVIGMVSCDNCSLSNH